MADSMSYNTPSELLAQKIVARYVELGLLPEAYSSEAQRLLISGVSKPEDWQLLAEKALELENKGGRNEQ